MQTSHPRRYVQKLGSPPRLITALRKTSETFYAVDMLRRFAFVFTDTEYAALFFDCAEEGYVNDLLQNPHPSSDVFEVLHDFRLLPTPIIMEAVGNGRPQSSIRSKIEAAKSEITHGGFNPSNLFHIELAYSAYRLNGLPAGAESCCIDYDKMSLTTFSELPWLDSQDVILGAEDNALVEKTTEEAADVLKLVNRKKKSNPLLVIANMRYGSQFVISPIEDRLLDIKGVRVVHEYVPSYNFDFLNKREKSDDQKYAQLSDKTWEFILQHNPDIMVVDGSQHNTDCRKTRFPAAMWEYVNAFRMYSEACSSENENISNNALIKYFRRLRPSHPYEIVFWAPHMRENISIGWLDYTFVPRGNEDRELTIVCSTSYRGFDGKFDDPEEYVKKRRLGFTSKGLGYAPVAKDEYTFVLAIQEMIKKIRCISALVTVA